MSQQEIPTLANVHIANTPNWVKQATDLGLHRDQASTLERVVLQLRAGQQGYELPRFPPVSPPSQKRDTLGIKLK